MSDTSSLQQSLDTHFKTHIDDVLTTVRCGYDNVHITPKQSDTDGCIRHSVFFEERPYVAVGNTLKRQFGTVQIELFLPSGEGSKKALDIADLIDSAYSGQCVGSIRFQASTMPFRGVIGDFYKVNILIPYYNDQKGA